MTTHLRRRTIAAHAAPDETSVLNTTAQVIDVVVTSIQLSSQWAASRAG